MKCIIDESGLDISIEVMNTERDEEFANKLLEEELRYIQEQQIEERVEEQKVEERVEDEEPLEEPLEEKPICSFTSRRGLTIPELKKIAKKNHLPTSGNKEELCKRLAENDLVQII